MTTMTIQRGTYPEVCAMSRTMASYRLTPDDMTAAAIGCRVSCPHVTRNTTIEPDPSVVLVTNRSPDTSPGARSCGPGGVDRRGEPGGLPVRHPSHGPRIGL